MCEHKYYLEPAKEDLKKCVLTNIEMERVVLRCRKCKKEIPYPMSKWN